MSETSRRLIWHGRLTTNIDLYLLLAAYPRRLGVTVDSQLLSAIGAKLVGLHGGLQSCLSVRRRGEMDRAANQCADGATLTDLKTTVGTYQLRSYGGDQWG